MRCTLISGPVGSGKTGRIIQSLKDTGKLHASRIIVPAETVAREMRQRVLDTIEKPLVGDIVIAWPHFVRNLAGITQPALSTSHLALFLMPLLRSHPLRYFRADTISWGIARAFAHTIVTLKHNLISPANLRAELETRGSLKENDLLTVYERYEEERAANKLFDGGDVTLVAAERLHQGDAGCLEALSFIAFDEWYHLPPGMRAIIAALKQCDHPGTLTIALPSCDDDGQPFVASWRQMIAQIERIADGHEKLAAPSRTQADLTAHVLRSPSVEVQYLARKLADSTSVIARSETTTQSRCDMPKERDRRVALRAPRDDNLGLHARDDNRLRAPRDDSNSKGSLDCARDDKLSSTTVVLRGGDEYLDALLAQCARYGLLDSAAVLARPMDAPLIHRLFSPDAVAALPETGTIEEFALRLIDCARESSAAKLDAASLQNAPDRSAAGRTARAVFLLTEHARSLVTHAQALMREPIARSTFLEIMREQVNSAPSWSAANSHLPFTITSFEHPPVSSLKRAFVPHMVEGHIPQTAGTQLFFGDMEDWSATRTESVLDEIFVTPEKQLAREAALVHALTAKCTEKVVFTLPLIDGGGSETAPSSFLDSLEQPTPIDLPPDLDTRVATPAMLKRLDQVITIEQERARGERTTPAYHGIIAATSLAAMIKKRFTETRFSPTSLERFAVCPFQFFALKVLNLEPEEEVSPEILPKDRGTIVHAVLEKFYRNHLDAFRSALSMTPKSAYEKLEGIVDQLVDSVFCEHASLIGYASPSLDAYQRRAVTTMTWQVIKMELTRARDLPDPLIPVQCEWAFGRERDAPLELAVKDDKPALIKGVVDRIDANTDASRFAIADYKTGRSVTSVRAKILGGLHLQLPLYVMAAQKLLYPDAEPLGGVLIGVQMSEKDHGFLKKEFNTINFNLRPRLATLMDDDAWHDALEMAREHTARYVTEIRAGRFPAKPNQCTETCDCKDVCRYHERAH